ERERWSGLAEVVKCALLQGGELLEQCEAGLEAAARGDAAALEPLIEGAVRLKAKVVSEDERETGGSRASLHLRHTLGPSLEPDTSYRGSPHGEAVALGLRGMLTLSTSLPAAERKRAEKLVARLQISVPAALDADQREAALQAMSRDKKARAGKVRFVLLDRL